MITVLIFTLLVINLFIGLKVLVIYKKEIKDNKEYIQRVENTVLHYQKNVNNTLTETLRQRQKVDYISEVSSKMDNYVSKRTRYYNREYRKYPKYNRIRTSHLGGAPQNVKVGFRLR